MNIKKSDLISTYAQSIGIEAAKELIAKTINAAALKGGEKFTLEETDRIYRELAKEGGLIRIVAQTFMIQLERKKSEEQALLLDNIETQIWYLTDVGTYGAVNRAHAEFLGIGKENLEGRNIRDIYGCDEAMVVIADNRDVFDQKKQIRTEGWVGNGAGEARFLSITRTPKLDDNGEVEYVICTAEDITERKRAEDQIRASLKEKEVLLQEIHHRVKNNLQVVASLLSMQERTTKDKDAAAILADSRNRINTMALIHSQLYESKNLSEVTMKGFVDTLLRQLFMSYQVQDTRVTEVVRVADCPFPISIAVPIGLILNELLSNASKHAFCGRKEGTIKIVLDASDEGKWDEWGGESGGGRISLIVSDDGVGLPRGFDIGATPTLGLRLVKILVTEQLHGNLEITDRSDSRDGGGTTFKIEFDIYD